MSREVSYPLLSLSLIFFPRAWRLRSFARGNHVRLISGWRLGRVSRWNRRGLAYIPIYPPAAPRPGSYRGPRPSSPGVPPGAPLLLFSSRPYSSSFLFPPPLLHPLFLPSPPPLAVVSDPPPVRSRWQLSLSRAPSTAIPDRSRFPSRAPCLCFSHNQAVCSSLRNDPRRSRAGAKRTGGCDSRRRFSSIESVLRWLAMRCLTLTRYYRVSRCVSICVMSFFALAGYIFVN